MYTVFVCSECVNRFYILLHYRSQALKSILKLLAMLGMEKTMVTKVISELKSISGHEIFPETGNWTQACGV